MKLLVFDKNVNQIVGRIEVNSLNDLSNPLTGPLMDYIIVPDEIHLQDADVDVDESGQRFAVENQQLKAARTQASRNQKLAQTRFKRDELLKQVDVMVNELALGVRNDQQAVRDYRAELLSFTNMYKDQNGNATAAIDSLDIDDADSWPTAP